MTPADDAELRSLPAQQQAAQERGAGAEGHEHRREAQHEADRVASACSRAASPVAQLLERACRRRRRGSPAPAAARRARGRRSTPATKAVAKPIERSVEHERPTLASDRSGMRCQLARPWRVIAGSSALAATGRPSDAPQAGDTRRQGERQRQRSHRHDGRGRREGHRRISQITMPPAPSSADRRRRRARQGAQRQILDQEQRGRRQRRRAPSTLSTTVW